MGDPHRDPSLAFASAPVIAIPIFIRFGMYRAVMRYFGNDALITICKAVSLSALLLALVVYWYSNHTTLVPRSIIFNFWWLSLIMLGGLRLMMRQYFLGDWFSAAQHVPLRIAMMACPRLRFTVRVRRATSSSPHCVWGG